MAEIALVDLGGFTVGVCQSGLEALEKAPAFGPDVIILDVMMAAMDGIETFHALKADARLALAPAIFMTAKVQSQEIENYKAIGIAGVIPKLFDAIVFSDQIRALWDELQSTSNVA